MQLHSSYSLLGKDFKNTFDDLVRRMNEQQTEADRVRRYMIQADAALLGAHQDAQIRISQVVDEEKQKAAVDRERLLLQVTSLINASAETQEKRMADKLYSVKRDLSTSQETYGKEQENYVHLTDKWTATNTSLVDSVLKSRDSVKSKIKADWTAANDHTVSITRTTTSVHDETVQIVDAQMAHMDTQLVALDEIVSRVREQNNTHHTTHTTSLSHLAANIHESYTSIGAHFLTSKDRVRALNSDMQSCAANLEATLPSLSADGGIRAPLRDLRKTIASTDITEYTATGETPLKVEYTYPTALPRTDDHGRILARLRGEEITRSPAKDRRSPSKASPSKAMVFTDAPVSVPSLALSGTTEASPETPVDPVRP
ncbi:Kinesin-related motor protein, partial [Cryomyces antarcticus]